ncbi:MAG: cysteine--1-D-myo-inosityl 2-amino-2-deoxy-alpha-D-glucopyranoside ligase, partial [Propionibacteriaceae bacterium]
MRAWTAPEVPQLDPLAERPRLRLFDTARQQLLPAGPQNGDGRPARIYVCGITPYDATHIGHANTYVAFDLLNRVWRDA